MLYEVITGVVHVVLAQEPALELSEDAPAVPISAAAEEGGEVRPAFDPPGSVRDTDRLEA